MPFSYSWLTEENKAKMVNRGLTPDLLHIQHIYNVDFEEEGAKAVNIKKQIGRQWRNEGLTIVEKTKYRS